jgi:hypothetical protein
MPRNEALLYAAVTRHATTQILDFLQAVFLPATASAILKAIIADLLQVGQQVDVNQSLINAAFT